MSRFFIRFRYISSYDYNTPLMYIPLEQTIVSAEDQWEAIEQFKENLKPLNPDNIRIESVEQFV